MASKLFHAQIQEHLSSLDPGTFWTGNAHNSDLCSTDPKHVSQQCKQRWNPNEQDHTTDVEAVANEPFSKSPQLPACFWQGRAAVECLPDLFLTYQLSES